MVMRYKASQYSITENDICKHAQIILKRLHESGYDAYIVGGAVRDLLHGTKPKDFDIATNAHPEQIKKVFSNCRLIGRRFRLAHVYFGHDVYEVATFRAPHDDSDSGVTNNDGRIIHDNVYGNMEEDAKRRDFTVNALYYDIRHDEIIDYTNGLVDAQQEQLRLIGDPELRYREDPVRMLRAIRIAIKLGYSIEEGSEQPIKELSPLLGNIAPARLFDEALKMFHSGFGTDIFYSLRYYGLYQYLFPAAERSISAELAQTDEDEVITPFLDFVEIALQNTDRRIHEGFSVTPAFLYAVKLWEAQQVLVTQYREKGEPDYQANQMAANDVFQEQIAATSVPRRFSNVTRDIWLLQARFHRRDCKSANYFVESRRFRAAYDFFCLRSKIQPDLAELCQWWTDFYDADEAGRADLCKGMATSKRRGRRTKKRKKPS